MMAGPSLSLGGSTWPSSLSRPGWIQDQSASSIDPGCSAASRWTIVGLGLHRLAVASERTRSDPHYRVVRRGPAAGPSY